MHVPPPPQTYDRFMFNAVFDLPFFFARGTDRMRVLSNVMAVPFIRVLAEPRLVSVQVRTCMQQNNSETSPLRLAHADLAGQHCVDSHIHHSVHPHFFPLNGTPTDAEQPCRPHRHGGNAEVLPPPTNGGATFSARNMDSGGGRRA